MYSSKLDEILAHGKIRSQSTSASLVEMSAAEDENQSETDPLRT